MNVVKILMISSKMATSGRLTIIFFLKKRYDVIISVLDVTKNF